MKNMNQIKYSYAEKYKQSIDVSESWQNIFENHFKAGWDARDKIDNEALKVAVEELSLISIQKTKAEYEYDEDDLWDFVCASEAYEIAILKARKALDKICELRGI